jgi:rod shape-determining protein MreC
MGAGSFRGYRSGRSSASPARTLTWLLVVAALGTVGLVMSFTGRAQPLQSAAQRAAEPVTAALQRATAPLADLVANAGSYGRLRDENRALRAENERLRVELSRVREDETRASEVADLLNIGNKLGSDQVTYATIIARDPSPLRDVVAINRGTHDGVQRGMPVLGKGGALLGTVERTGDSVAWVRLITDAQSSVNAIVQESRGLALASGSPDRTLHLDFVDQNVAVKAGDTVLTSGLGGTYPQGLLIGRVTKVEGGPQEIFKRVQVEPAVRLSSLQAVAVMTGFRPTPIEGQGS